MVVAQTFGSWLEERLTATGMRRSDLADKVGCSPALISAAVTATNYKTGARGYVPGRKRALAIARVLARSREEYLQAASLAGYDPEPEHVSAYAAAAQSQNHIQVPEEPGGMASSNRDLACRDALRRQGGRADGVVGRINQAFLYARYTLKATGGGYDLEIRAPIADYDRDGLDDRLAFVRQLERDHDLKLLPDEIR